MICRKHRKRGCLLTVACRHDLIAQAQAAILTTIQRIEGRIESMATEIERLTASVARNTNTIESAIVLIRGINDRIKAAGTDPAKLAALTNDLDREDDALAAAVAENTPAAAPPAEPTPSE